MKNKKHFFDYMPNRTEYPDPTQMDIYNDNWCMSYISSNFLNGWINYITPIVAFAVNRYRETDTFQDKIQEWEATKNYHSDLNFFKDDIVILGKTPKPSDYYKYDQIKNAYWFFWFDQDVSDCCIGRFETDDDTDIVIDHFKQNLNEWLEDGSAKTIYRIDVKSLSGWLQF